MLNDNNIILIISNLSRYHLFPVQHEIRRRKRDYNRALSQIRCMDEPYISPDSNACDGINYWELADRFSSSVVAQVTLFLCHKNRVNFDPIIS
jgi:hypothetical protein